MGLSDGWDWEWKGASSGVGVMLVSDTALWLEKGGTDNWKKVREILVTDLVFCLSNITMACPSCVLPTPYHHETHFAYLHLLGFPDVYLLGLYLKLS